MKYLCDTLFSELLAPSIAGDSAIGNAARALDREFLASTLAIPTVLLFARLAQDSGFVSPVSMLPPLERLAARAGGLPELSDEILDLLAWQFHVEGYELAQDRQARREIIQNSLLLHRRKGTVWSLRRALAILMRRDVQIPEWFNYDGKPYYFRVRFDISQLGFFPEQWEPLLSTIHDWKNVRSWLEGIWTYGKTPMERIVAIGLRGMSHGRSCLWFRSPAIPRLPSIKAVSQRAHTRTGLRLYFPVTGPATVWLSTAPGIKSWTISRPGVFFAMPPGPEGARGRGACGCMIRTGSCLGILPACFQNQRRAHA